MISRYRNDTPETVRITYGDYNKMVETAKKAIAYSEEQEKEGRVAFDPSAFPLLEDLTEHDIRYQMRKYLPYLVIYYEPGMFETDSDDYEATKEYVQSLFDNYVQLMDDEDCEAIRSMTPEKWAAMNVDERADVLRPMIWYYGWNEFDSFRRDLGWLPFMTYAKCSKKKYMEGKKNTRIENDLRDVWAKVFDIKQAWKI